MADPQHPAVPFEQAVDLLTGEPRPLQPQHPGIAALVEELGGYANLLRMLHPKQNEKSAALVDRTIAALRTLARPVEDEEAAKWLRRFNAYGGEFEEAASLLARLAREKASAEQERDKAVALSCHGATALRQVRDQCDGRAREIAETALSKPEFTAAIDRATRAEQEIARLLDEMRKIADVGKNRRTGETGYMGEHHAECQAIAERALAAAAGAEEPR